MAKKALFPYTVIFILVIAVYSNTFTAPWFFDDMPNIVNNAPLHIDNLMPETLWQTFFAKPFKTGQLYRPVACLSFALNWFVGQDNTVGYHIVNVVIHCLTAFFLYLTVIRLYQTPRLSGTQSPQAVYAVALLTAVLWCLNPIHTQAVTYLVQRMASLAGMFYLIAMYAYLSGRLQPLPRLQYRMLAICMSSFLLALGSKENAILLPLSLLLVEYAFFNRPDDKRDRIFFRLSMFISMLILVMGAAYLIRSGLVENFFRNAGSRPFSPFERILTEGRIVLYYLGLIFYPIPSRLSIDHDVIISTSFFAPWTTALSIFAILAFVSVSFWMIRKQPLIGFALPFFFLNHLVESTIIPLELIFEHRNYISSFFLFLPISAGIYALLTRFLSKSQLLKGVFILSLGLIISGIGVGTYVRNMTYASSEALWSDSLKKAPLSARALSNLGIHAGWNEGKSAEKLRQALALNYKALNSFQQRNTFKPTILLNIGNLYFNYGLYEQAIDQYKKSLSMKPSFTDARYHLARAYIKNGDFSSALEQIERVINNNPPRSLFFNVHGLALMWAGRPEEALLAFRKAMYLRKEKQLAYYHVGAALSLSGHYDQATWFLKKARNRDRNNIRIAFSMLENSIRAEDSIAIEQNCRYLFSQFDMVSIKRAIEILPREYSSVPVDVERIEPIIASMAAQMAVSLFNSDHNTFSVSSK